MVNTDNRCRSVSGGTSASCECSGCDMAESGLGYWAECTSRKRYVFFFGVHLSASEERKRYVYVLTRKAGRISLSDLP